MYNIITISGLSYTGTTSLANELANQLGWRYVSAGQRFRDFCEQHELGITSIPDNIHLEFDNVMRSDLISNHNTVFEGRYLGHFCEGRSDVLKVYLEAKLTVRYRRCLARETTLTSIAAAEKFVNQRDEKEAEIAKSLYDINDFTDVSVYDLVLHSDDEKEIQSNLPDIMQKLERPSLNT